RGDNIISQAFFKNQQLFHDSRTYVNVQMCGLPTLPLNKSQTAHILTRSLSAGQLFKKAGLVMSKEVPAGLTIKRCRSHFYDIYKAIG
ncbi:hypothetical protein P4T79_17155, partial [Bacillus mojavensis]|uniref:hypothetical protein n=1 Tax=Bacillus mojavensis TaxID=72360 RepID=UPI002DBE4ACD